MIKLKNKKQKKHKYMINKIEDFKKIKIKRG
jgi:hypothetical protein